MASLSSFQSGPSVPLTVSLWWLKVERWLGVLSCHQPSDLSFLGLSGKPILALCGERVLQQGRVLALPARVMQDEKNSLRPVQTTAPTCRDYLCIFFLTMTSAPQPRGPNSPWGCEYDWPRTAQLEDSRTRPLSVLLRCSPFSIFTILNFQTIKYNHVLTEEQIFPSPSTPRSLEPASLQDFILANWYSMGGSSQLNNSKKLKLSENPSRISPR